MAKTAIPDLTEFESPSQVRCKVRACLDALSDTDRKKFEAALATERFSSVRIAERFSARGLPVSDTVVRRHRRKACGCE